MSTSGALSRIRMQIMWNRLISVVEEQAQALLRTAFSSMVRECGDLSAGVFDLEGRMLAQAVTGTPGHVNSMAESVVHFIAHFPIETMREGDIYITNDPWQGTGHLNDFVLTTPAFHKGHLVGLFSCTSHLIDIGGIGFGPDATDVHMEGIYIPFLKLAEEGKLNQSLMAMIKANTRQPVETEGDVYSLAACNDVGCQRLSEMMDEFALDNLDELSAHIIDSSRDAVLARIAELPEGTYHNSVRADGYDHEVDVIAAMTISAEGIYVNYEGTAPISKYGINVPLSYTKAYTCYGLACTVAAGIPNNAGSLAPFTISAPVGSILNAVYPAPVSSRHIVGHMLPDTIFGCLKQAIPDGIPAEGSATLWILSYRGRHQGANEPDAGYTTSAVTAGGTGARPNKDGLSATGFPSGVKGTPVEILESTAPVVVWRKELHTDSAGAGRYRGGLGQVIEVESRDGSTFELLAAFERIKNPACGRDGGLRGGAGYLGLASGSTLRGKGFQEIPEGERLIVRTPGGGGMGVPTERDPSAVQADVLDGLVSAEAADSIYGVVMTADGAIDAAATEARRNAAS
ncbi:MAG TPA: hydantoinase B/oxoprolinase family protein [Rhodospirillales bacterium]|nr:hydantoinase B/oxoprolinase family protein [Rhodospirillales bacterium]